jgi:hypothetical protein
MNEMSRHQVRLRKGTVWSATARQRPLHVSCGTGIVWITEEGDSRDVVLHAGEAFDARADGLLAIQALTDAVIAAEFRGDEDKGPHANAESENHAGCVLLEKRQSGLRCERERLTMYTTPKSMLAVIGLALVAMTAWAADAAPEQAVVASPVDTIAALPADPLFASVIQGTVGDIANISLWLAWAAVAMLLALCWSEWAHSQQANRSYHVPRRQGPCLALADSRQWKHDDGTVADHGVTRTLPAGRAVE